MSIEFNNSIGYTVNARAKHTDGDFFSTDYATASITLEEIPFVNLYAINNNSHLDNAEEEEEKNDIFIKTEFILLIMKPQKLNL